jgi:SAM-dependent methyltransferase
VAVVHRVAAQGFARSAEAYDRGRPGYPAEAIEWLRGRLDLGPTTRVVDLAAGTGKLSRALAATGCSVTAVEPVAEMRALIPSPVDAVEGTAEAIPLGDSSADLVAVGQAFHWFDWDPALAEIRRVLGEGGHLALVWNVRILEDPMQAAVEELLSPYTGGIPRHRNGDWRRSLEASPLFGPLEEESFPNDQVLDAEALADRVGSTSVIGALPDDERSGVLSQARALADDGPVLLRYRCEIQVASRAP